MADVAQLAEHLVVAQVAGSSNLLIRPTQERTPLYYPDFRGIRGFCNSTGMSIPFPPQLFVDTCAVTLYKKKKQHGRYPPAHFPHKGRIAIFLR